MNAVLLLLNQGARLDEIVNKSESECYELVDGRHNSIHRPNNGASYAE
jgi:hypothetical protein